MPLETQHLLLVPYAPADLLALVEGEDRFAESFGRRAAPGLRAFFVSDDVSPDWVASLRAATEADPWVHGFALVDRETGMVVGNLGFTGPPDRDGVVEMAYAVVPSFEGRGYASEAARAGLGFAVDDDRVATVRAHTRAEVSASTRILTRLGFERIADLDDPKDGPIWRWERS